MKISEMLDIKSIVLNLEVNSKNELIEKLLNLAENQETIIDKEKVKNEVFERENIMSTGIGKGVALPHAKTNVITNVTIALATLKKPIDFDSLDKKPVNIATLLLGMESNVGLHLRLLSKISRLMNNDSFRSQLCDLQNAKKVIELIQKYEERD